ncbi:hypothetical protein BN1708_011342, partial [Verticillium longisporum]
QKPTTRARAVRRLTAQIEEANGNPNTSDSEESMSTVEPQLPPVMDAPAPNHGSLVPVSTAWRGVVSPVRPHLVPIYVRGNELGQTWYAGPERVYLEQFSSEYLLCGTDCCSGGLHGQERQYLLISTDWVSLEALEYHGLKYKVAWQHYLYLSPDLKYLPRAASPAALLSSLSSISRRSHLINHDVHHPSKLRLARGITMASADQGGAQKAGGGGDSVTYDGKEYDVIQEGMARILVPGGMKENKDKNAQQVFYNPIQQFNRDLSVLAIKAYGEEVIANRKGHPAAKRLDNKEKKRRRGDENDGNDRPAKVQVSEGEGEGDAEVTITKTSDAAAAPAPATAAETEGNGSTEEPKKPEPQPRFTILDALSASGLRALRYSHELPFVTSVTANDLTKSAAESIQLNVKHNGLEDKIVVNHDDAIAHMYRRIADDLSNRDSRGRPGTKNKYDVIDLDPYGTAAPFIDAALQAVRDDGGLLCVTCTDGSHWAGHCYAERSFALYGAVPVKGMHSHEAGLRLILHTLASTAARHGLHVEPLLSLSIDFYCRLWVRVTKSANAISFLGGKTMVAYQCSGCTAWETQSLVRTRAEPKKKGGHFFKHSLAKGPPTDGACRHCGSAQHVAGPMYGGAIHDQGFVRRVLDLLPTADPAVYGTLPRIEGMLTTALEEYLPGPEPAGDVDAKEAALARVDSSPFFIMPSKLAGFINAQQVPDNMFRGALKHLGYRVTRSHCRPGSIKTDAPWDTIWFIMREWVRQKAPVKTERIRPTMPAYRLLGLDKEAAVPAEEAAVPAADAGVSVGDAGEDTIVTQVESTARRSDEAVAQDTHMGDASEAALTEADLRKTLVFDDALIRLGRARDNRKLVRYQLNPRENWGPMTRAKGK